MTHTPDQTHDSHESGHHIADDGKMVPDVHATCAPEVAEFIDPTGSLRASGLLKVQA